MDALFNFFGLALQNLRRGGQRVVVTWLCIAFGVAALVALTMIAESIEESIMVGPAELVGGDISLVRADEGPVRTEHVAQLDDLRQEGVISGYTLIAFNSASIAFKPHGAGPVEFAGIGMGIQPDSYPLAGSLTIGEPAGAAVADLLGQPGDVVVTRDIALAYGLRVGDPFGLADLRAGETLAGTLRGIAYDTPNHQGDKIYYTLETAERLAGGLPAVNTVIANASQGAAASAALEQAGWTVDWLAGRRDANTGNAWSIGLRGARMLGLLVGGIGIANTMQVLLRRSQREIAIWKTLGYRAGQLRLIFTLEAGLLGLLGSLPGAGLGILVSGGVLELIRRMSSVLYQVTFSLQPAVLGVLVGTLTTIIFAAWAIVTSSQVRPMTLLRGERVQMQPTSGCLTGALGLLLAAPLTGVATLVMGSLLAGIAALLVVLFGLAVLAGFFRILLWLGARAFPTRRLPLARLAVSSLRRRGGGLVFAMVALFMGASALSAGLLVTRFGELRGGPGELQGYSLTVLAGADHEERLRQELAALDLEKVGEGYRAALAGVQAAGGGPLSGVEAVLVGRSDPADYRINGAAWGSQPGGVYLPAEADAPASSQVEVILSDGKRAVLTVAGSYEVNYDAVFLAPPAGVLIETEAFSRITRPVSLTWLLQPAPGQIRRTADSLSAALPQAALVDLAAYAGRYMRSYQKIFVLPLALSGPALLAGCLLVANSVSLAMLERRYEIGILKAVGYSRRQVLTIYGLEYGLVGVLAAGAGVIMMTVLVLLLIVGTELPVSVLFLAVPPLGLAGLICAGLTVLTALGSAWTPTRVPPSVMLNER